MSGGVPPYMNMFGATGMPNLSQSTQPQQQKAPTGTQQKEGARQVTPPNNQFMYGAAQVVVNQPQQHQQQNSLLNNGNMPRMNNAQIPPNPPPPPPQGNPLFLANAALMAGGNVPNKNINAYQNANGHQELPPNPKAMFLANVARMQQAAPNHAREQALAFANMVANSTDSGAPKKLHIVVPPKVGKPLNSKDTNEENKTYRAIRHPHDHDVMCGRGGQSNFFPGNIWFRRLVRCNRGLYRESAKYTKLLVSKAIVQAVHSQNPPGRFIECDRATGLWHEIPYKKALDKTSQALREKDKEGEDEDGDVNGTNLTLVRIPLPEDATQNAQVFVNTPQPVEKRNNRNDNNMPFLLPPPQQSAMPMYRNMTPEQAVQQASMLQAAGMNQQANTVLQAAGITPQQQAQIMMQFAGAPGTAPPTGMQNVQQTGNVLLNQGPPGQTSSSLHRKQIKADPAAYTGPTVPPSNQPPFLQNLPPQLASILRSNPMLGKMTPASGAPTVLGPSGAPRQMASGNMPPSAMPQMMSSTAQSMFGPNGPPSVACPPPGPIPATQPQNGAAPNVSFNVGMSAPNKAGFGAGAAAPSVPTPSIPTKVDKSPTAALEGLANIAAVQAMAPTASRPPVPQPSVGGVQQNKPQQQLQNGTSNRPQTSQHAGMLQQQQYQSGLPSMQQMGPQQQPHPPAGQQMGMLQQQQQSCPPMTLQMQMMQQHQRQLPFPPAQQIMGMPPFVQQFPPATAQQFEMMMMQLQQQQAQQQSQQARMMEQAGMKRPPIPNQMHQMDVEQPQFKKQRVQEDTASVPSENQQQVASSMAEFLQVAQSFMDKGGNSAIPSLQMPANLDQMTPQQTQLFALQLLQIAQQKQAQQDAEQARAQAASSLPQQKTEASATPPEQQHQQDKQLPQTGLQRTDHSIGSLGSHSLSSSLSRSSTNTSSSDGRLSSQMSDWLQHFFPVQQQGDREKSLGSIQQGDIPPPPQALEQSVSEALLSLATGPSKFLSGISSLLDRDSSGASTISAFSTDGMTYPQANRPPVPAWGSMISKQTSTTLPRRGTKTIPQKQLLKLQPRSNNRRNQRPLLPLRPRISGGTTKQLLPLQPRPSSTVVQEQLQKGQPPKKSIQEEMLEILKRSSANAPSAKPGARPMLQLKRSETFRSEVLPAVSADEEKKDSDEKRGSGERNNSEAK